MWCTWVEDGTGAATAGPREWVQTVCALGERQFSRTEDLPHLHQDNSVCAFIMSWQHTGFDHYGRHKQSVHSLDSNVCLDSKCHQNWLIESWKSLTVCIFYLAKISHTFQLLFSTAALPCGEFTFNMSRVLYILTYLFSSQTHARVNKIIFSTNERKPILGPFKI